MFIFPVKQPNLYLLILYRVLPCSVGSDYLITAFTVLYLCHSYHENLLSIYFLRGKHYPHLVRDNRFLAKFISFKRLFQVVSRSVLPVYPPLVLCNNYRFWGNVTSVWTYSLRYSILSLHYYSSSGSSSCHIR